MFTGNHVVMVSQYGMPSVVNLRSLDYPIMVQSGNYKQYTEEPVTKREAEDIEQTILEDFLSKNE